MDLSDLFGGEGKGNLLAMLMPMLLGGKNADLFKLLGSLPGKGAGRASITSDTDSDYETFPPLFGFRSNGEKQEGVQMSDLLGMLSGITGRNGSEKNIIDRNAHSYPYELQYNHPDR